MASGVAALAANSLQLAKSSRDALAAAQRREELAANFEERATKAMNAAETEEERTAVQKFFYPSKEVWRHQHARSVTCHHLVHCIPAFAQTSAMTFFGRLVSAWNWLLSGLVSPETNLAVPAMILGICMHACLFLLVVTPSLPRLGVMTLQH